MRWRRTGIAIAALAAAFAGLPAAARAALPEATAEPWIEIRTGRFAVYTNAGEEVGKQAARRLERLADVLDRTTSGLRTDGRRTVRVFVFRNARSFDPYQPFGTGETQRSAGFHVRAEDVESIATFADDPRVGRFLAHEYMHAVLSRSLGSLPVWLNEGLAEFYSTFEARGRGATIGQPIPEHVQWLRGRMLTAAELFAISLDSRSYQEGDRRGTIYAQSWGLVHLLYFDAGGPERFDRLMGEVARGATSQEAVRAAYGPNAPDSLTTALRSAMSALAVPVLSWEFDEPLDAVEARTRPVPRAEVLSLIGELLVESGPEHVDRAREHLLAARSTDSTSAVAAACLAILAREAGDTTDAAPWEAAVARAPGADPRAGALLGAWLSRLRLRTEPTGWPARGASPLALRSRDLLRPMLDRHPEALEWLVPYAFTFLEERGDVNEAIVSLALAREAWPHNTDLEGALCVLQVRAGRVALAERLFAEISPGPGRDEWRRYAGMLIAAARLDSLPEMVRQGRHADAESLAVRVAREVPEAAARRRAEDLLAWIRKSGARPEKAPGSRAAKTPGAPGGAGTGSGSGSGGGSGGGAVGGAGSGGPAGTSRLQRAERAMRAGDYAAAERAYLAERTAAGDARERSHLDSLAAEARNRRRLEGADQLVSSGLTPNACTLLEMILGDRPSAAMRREVERRQRRYCTR